jgi:DNA polymerase III sliding clamp (beta) subunit (PCNA family)
MLQTFLTEACRQVISLATATVASKPQMVLQSDGAFLRCSLESGGASVHLSHPWTSELFAVTLDPHILQEVIAVESEVNRLALENTTLILSSSRGETHLNVNLAEAQGVPTKHEGVVVSSSTLREALALVKHALAAKPKHGYDGLFLFDFTAGELVATDSFRLALQTLPKLGLAAFKVSKWYALMLEELPDGEISLALMSDHVHLRQDGYALTLPLDHTGFPDYHRILPTANHNGTEVELHAKELREVVARVGLLDETKGLVLTFEKHRLTVSAQGSEGHSSETLPMAIRGPVVTLHLHKTYLEEALASASGMVRWRIGKANEASVFELEGGLRLLVPLKA